MATDHDHYVLFTACQAVPAKPIGLRTSLDHLRERSERIVHQTSSDVNFFFKLDNYPITGYHSYMKIKEQLALRALLLAMASFTVAISVTNTLNIVIWSVSALAWLVVSVVEYRRDL